MLVDPWVGKIPWRRAWQPTPVFLPGDSRGQRSLEGHEKSDTTEVTHGEKIQAGSLQEPSIWQSSPVFPWCSQGPLLKVAGWSCGDCCLLWICSVFPGDEMRDGHFCRNIVEGTCVSGGPVWGSGDRVPSLVMFTLTPAHLESAGFSTALFSSLCSQGVFEKACFPVSLSPASFSMHWYFLPELSN